MLQLLCRRLKVNIFDSKLNSWDSGCNQAKKKSQRLNSKQVNKKWAIDKYIYADFQKAIKFDKYICSGRVDVL